MVLGRIRSLKEVHGYGTRELLKRISKGVLHRLINEISLYFYQEIA